MAPNHVVSASPRAWGVELAGVVAERAGSVDVSAAAEATASGGRQCRDRAYRANATNIRELSGHIAPHPPCQQQKDLLYPWTGD
jgi:hypothetical protein